MLNLWRMQVMPKSPTEVYEEKVCVFLNRFKDLDVYRDLELDLHIGKSMMAHVYR